MRGAAVLGWLAADRAGRVQLSALHGAECSRGVGLAVLSTVLEPERGGEFAADLTRDGATATAGTAAAGYTGRSSRARLSTGRRGEQDADGYGWQDDRPGRRGDGGWGSRDDADGEHWDGYPARGLDRRFRPRRLCGRLTPRRGISRPVISPPGTSTTGDFNRARLPPAIRTVTAGATMATSLTGAAARDEPSLAGPDGSPGALGHRLPGHREPAQFFGQIAIYTLLEDRVEEFDQLTERVVDQVRSREPDTLVFIVHAVPSAPMQRILYEVYRDRTAYERHYEQPYVQQFESDRRPFVLATNVIELGLQQAKVSPFPSVADCSASRDTTPPVSSGRISCATTAGLPARHGTSRRESGEHAGARRSRCCPGRAATCATTPGR